MTFPFRWQHFESDQVVLVVDNKQGIVGVRFLVSFPTSSSEPDMKSRKPRELNSKVVRINAIIAIPSAKRSL